MKDIQTKEELERWYEQEDPWNYRDVSDDTYRRGQILEALSDFGPFERCLDIGAGEGFITSELPARTIHAIEISDNAAERLPRNCLRVHEPDGQYDLVVATGVFYPQYDHKTITKTIIQAATQIILTCNISEWEINKLPADKLISSSIFAYREYNQILNVYDVSTA